MVERQVGEKLTKSFTFTESGTFPLVETNKTIVISDVIISKDDNSRVVFKMNDGTNEVPFLFRNSSDNISIPQGLMYWTGANLEVTIEGGLNLITIGYYLVTGDNYEKWRLHKNDI